MEEEKCGMHILFQGAQPILFDIVAIHGINGDPFKTWTHKENDVLWLRDLLPEELPNVRIMAFGYNARFKNFTTHQDLRTIAEKLITELVDVREPGGTSHPIVFICHSLGGIIAKKALLIGCAKEEAKVQGAVFAILFLGTPHNGSSLAKLGKVLANISAACTPFNPSKTLMSNLLKESEILLEITEDFLKRRRIIYLVSFYETEMTYIAPFFKRLIVEKHSAVLNTPDEITIGQPADHRQLVRFGSSKSITFRPVLSRLKDIEARIKADICAAAGIATDKLRLMKGKPDYIHEEKPRAHSRIPLDIPMASCSVFLGRSRALDQIQHFFFDQNLSKSRKIFAICGLGGTGKTQLALQYLSHNASRYETGVMLINATSRMSVDADFSRIHDSLHLEDGSNKVRSLRHWLAREDNSHWLMILDNADDLVSLRLETYLPSSWSGHILLTSRDQDAIGGVAEEGILLDTLALEDAVQLLLWTAGIRQPSESDSKNARDIAEHLGALPLALDQAGAFMRSRQKSPQQYRDLLVRAQYDLLGYRPRLSSSNDTVLSTWELNFQQIEHDPCRAADLLLLFSFLNPSRIEELILYRGVSPQKRWGEDGEVREVPAETEGVDCTLIELIRDEMKFDTAIEKLRSFSFISSKKDDNGLRVFSVHPLVQYCVVKRIESSVESVWTRQAVLMICHAFPRNRYLEPTNGELGRAMLPQLAHIFAAFDKLSARQGESSLIHREVAVTSIVASRFSDKQWKTNCMARANKALKVTERGNLDALLVYRESSLLRMAGEIEKSQSRLKEFEQIKTSSEDGTINISTARYNAQRADLIISFSENLICQRKFQDAIGELRRWEPMRPLAPSTLESIALRARDITLSKVLRYLGQFEDALQLSEAALDRSLSDDFFEGSGWYRVMLSNLADLYCELGQLEKGEMLLQKELEPMLMNGTQNIATGRRLRISLVEIFIQSAKFDKGKDILLQLERQYREENYADVTAHTYLFQVYIGMARIHHHQSSLREALRYWHLASTSTHDSTTAKGWTLGLVQLSIAYILHQTGDLAQSHTFLSQARHNFCSESRIYWIAGFNSHWHDYIKQRMNDECKCEFTESI